MSQTHVSVCMATYNGARYIHEQLESIRVQLGTNDEIIVSDDHSTDTTLQIIKSFNDPRIKIYINPGRSSLVSNFEHALKQASGQFVFLSDQDDIWLPNKVQKMLSILESFDLVLSDCEVVDASLHLLIPSFFDKYSSKPGFVKNLIKNSYLGCSMAFRRSVLNYVLPMPKSLLVHDSWIGLSVEMHGKVCFLKEPLMLYRRHDSNVSSSTELSRRPLLQKLCYRGHLFWALMDRKWIHRDIYNSDQAC